MPIEALLSYLERETEAETARLLADARAEAAAIEERTAAEAERRRATETDRLDRTSQAAIRDALVSVRHEQRRRLLCARADALDRVFSAASRILADAPVDRYGHRVAAWTEQALRYVEGIAASVVCPTATTALVTPLAAGPGIRIAPSDTARPGIVVRADDGSVLVDNTLQEQLARRRAELAIRLAGRLAADPDAMG